MPVLAAEGAGGFPTKTVVGAGSGAAVLVVVVLIVLWKKRRGEAVSA
jgi:hypothetical protein